MEKSLSVGGVTILVGWDLFFGSWQVTFFSVTVVGLLAFVSARKVVRCFEFRLRKDDTSASRTTAGSYFSAGSSSHASSSSSSGSFTNSAESEVFFFENIFSLRL
jgi:hypothetical protein